ncbi:iron-siderophore ABC transporter substrate-binding protein [Phyllobacterium salinisoli]|uniref:Iron-siderophore ABC transporter substrate-binding protein n=1 Tax=Phyllobacterium salinisoli TaxID=1899321 RepID=A0A368JX40_9HYPH|nr:ABC transporter substrate-binding protein [Phyllobacterium salinisoli]RCS21716.1 iron-siderophore ABC transporter substrate-binding protein [Phyllobacterium salinisoli]
MVIDRQTITRRTVLALAASAFAYPAGLRAASLPRIAAIDWAMLETALAIGAVPVAATELIQFRKIAIEPEVPQSVTDLGLRGAPNLELLRIVAPDLILSSSFYEYRRATFERIAPVLSATIYQAGTPPFAPARDAMLALGQRLGLEDAARAYIAATEREIANLRQRVKNRIHRPVFLISIGDARHFRAFGGDSMFGDVLHRIGLANAWKGETSYSATAPIGIEALASTPAADIVVIGPVPPEAREILPRSPIWNALPAVRDKRVAMFDPIDHFGGLPAARRFVRLLGQAGSFLQASSDG